MSEKILIINDDDSIREMIEFFLQSKGYQTFSAESGSQGIELAIKNKPDLILLDVIMPEIDGYMTCEKLKAHPLTRHIPVIFLSSLTASKDKIRGLELGAVDFINSVGDQGELLARVQTHLKIKNLTQNLLRSNQELTENLNAAAMIQRSFLLSPERKISGLEHASLWVPANLLGGDIYNAIPCKDNKVVLYMLDVSGHDVPSALVTVSVSQFLFLQNATKVISPKETLESLDKEYPLERFDRFFTLFYIVLDVSTGEMTYSCAGHPPAILLRKDNPLKMLNTGGTLIGLGNSVFEEGKEQLEVKDKILLYTDGLLENKNSKGDSYGMERLCGLLEKVTGESIAVVVETLKNDIEFFAEGNAAFDDLSLLGFEFLPYNY
jgi:phosphoserine phosphatase RsbU/P